MLTMKGPIGTVARALDASNLYSHWKGARIVGRATSEPTPVGGYLGKDTDGHMSFELCCCDASLAKLPIGAQVLVLVDVLAPFGERRGPVGWATCKQPDRWHDAETRECAIELARKRYAQDLKDEGVPPPVLDGNVYLLHGDWADPVDCMPSAESIIELMTHSAPDADAPEEMDDDDLWEFLPGASEALDRLLEAWASTYVRAKFWNSTATPEAVPAVAPEASHE